ncbi:hypothetical protein C8Q75DRAFT_91658 [Abortiporus biennis]|nr:hypothetical protein C8Q75DRAFT_91658 [Abortiporus biennis]
MSESVNRWAPGCCYGPVLTQTDLYLLDTELELNPILKNQSDAFQISFNVATGQVTGTNHESGDRELPFGPVKDEAATLPRVSELIVITDISPWCTTIKNPSGVTINDFCNSIWKEYTENMVTDKEFESLRPRDQETVRRYAANVAGQNWGGYYTPAPANIPTRYKRVDWLRDRVWFNKLSKNDNYAKARLGVSTPNIFVMSLKHY